MVSVEFSLLDFGYSWFWRFMMMRIVLGRFDYKEAAFLTAEVVSNHLKTSLVKLVCFPVSKNRNNAKR